MAIPSSPPALLVDFSESKDSQAASDAELPLFPPRGLSRKRQFSDYGSGSSDPVFSEDASEGDAADYEQPFRRRRKCIKGPWWQQRSRAKLSLRRSMARRGRVKLADSGIWMGSDSTDSTADFSFADREEDPAIESTTSRTLTRPNDTRPPAEALALSAIHACLESGQEMIDLTNLDLESLPSSILQPLHQLIRNSHTNHPQPPTEDEFRSLTPSIQLFLSGNKLASLPAELFSLTNITVLSLRNNSLESIPPAICRLQHLEELNISQNNIKHLPWELCDLIQAKGNSRRIILRPNPFVEPAEISGPYPLPRPNTTPAELIDALSKWGETNGAFHDKMRQWYQRDDLPWGVREELELRLKVGRTRRANYVQEVSRAGQELRLSEEPLIFLAPSAISFFDVDGSTLRGATRHDQCSERGAHLGAADLPPHSHGSHVVPSLLETSLRHVQQAYSSLELQDIPETYPAGLRKALRTTAENASYGGEVCTTCGRSFIIARAEWIEYWFNGFPSQEGLTQESILPFLRRTCSWRCAVPTELGGFRY